MSTPKTPKEYLKLLQDGTLKKDDSLHEIVSSIDETASIWSTPYGYYFLDTFDGTISTVFFKTEAEAKKEFKS